MPSEQHHEVLVGLELLKRFILRDGLHVVASSSHGM
jgi:hypothetical protein